jgi:hypothetical protein
MEAVAPKPMAKIARAEAARMWRLSIPQNYVKERAAEQGSSAAAEMLKCADVRNVLNGFSAWPQALKRLPASKYVASRQLVKTMYCAEWVLA